MKALLALVAVLAVTVLPEPRERGSQPAPLPGPLVKGLQNPERVAVGLGGKIFVTLAGDPRKDGKGSVVVLDRGKAVPFTTDLDDPRGIVGYQKWLFVTDR